MNDKPCKTAEDAFSELMLAALDTEHELIQCSIHRLNDGSGFVWDASWRFEGGNTAAVLHRKQRVDPTRGTKKIMQVLAAYNEYQAREQREAGLL